MGMDCKDEIRIIQADNPVGSKLLLYNSAKKMKIQMITLSDRMNILSIDVGFLYIYIYICMHICMYIRVYIYIYI